MKITLTYDVGTGPITVETNFWVITQWERCPLAKGRRITDLATGMGMDDLGLMTWYAAQSAGHEPMAGPWTKDHVQVYDDFIRRLQSLPDITGVESPRPTIGAPTDAA